MHKNNELITIDSLFGDKFRIPTYQRGYRWTRSQVEELLNDLKGFMESERAEGDFYCLQPLVVAEDAGEYRVIDGQQRLTTLWLLLHCMGNDEISIEYDRATMLSKIKGYKCCDYAPDGNRKWDAYLEKQWKEFADKSDLQNVELYHLFTAKLVIINWLRNNNLDIGFKHVVKVIWHIVPKEKERETFKHMNSGKIPLTNAELIKALFLGSYGVRCHASEIHKAIIAEEFDQFEQSLRRPDFWYFLNERGPQPTSCISFLFNIIQAFENPNAHDQRYRNYYFFRNQISNTDDANRIWSKVRTVFHTLEGWFDTPEIYNLVGYLSACGYSIAEIYRNYIAANSLEEFIAYLKYRCYKSIEWDIKDSPEQQVDYLKSTYRYDKNKTLTRRILLLMNIATLNLHQTSEQREGEKREISKFSFSDYHKCKWEVEHISPNNAVYRGDIEIDEMLGFDPSPYLNCKTKEIPDEHDKEAMDAYLASLDDSIMSLGNLTLLCKHINAKIGNDQFDGKRKSVIEEHSHGFYVLPCTMMVYTKAYLSSDDINRENKEHKINFWSDIDRSVYLTKILDVISRFFADVEEVGLTPKSDIQSTHVPVFDDDASIDSIPTAPDSYTQSTALEQINFRHIYDNYDYIIVPKIQRDYAQGRSKEIDDKADTIRRNLLDDIFKSKKVIDFQIVFGTREKRRQIDGNHSVEKNVFIPIDGQQRLTTLFLLSLYQAKCAGTSLQPKFIYETRRAATDFCYSLTVNPWQGFPEVSPAKAIFNSPWFMRYWKSDPTVDSMLVMLDAIHEMAVKYPRQSIDDIHFAFFDLGCHNISENIYLKMNSRGKDLTSFENLKADIEDKFKELPYGWKESIDGVWQDSFWSNENPTQVPDMSFLRFFANALYVLLLNEYRPQTDYHSNQSLNLSLEIDLDHIAQSLYEVPKKKLDDFISSEVFIEAIESLGAETTLRRMHKLLDFHSQAWPKRFDGQDDNPLYDFRYIAYDPLLDNNYSQRAVMYALILSIDNGATEKSQLTEWLRFIWNMAENDIDEKENFVTACRLFKRLSELGACRDILSVLQIPEAEKLSRSEQYQEEIEKAKVSGDKDLFDAIKSVERHTLLKGAIRPLFAPADRMIWDGFIDKSKSLRDLIPESKDARNTISLLVPYFDEAKLPVVFYHYYLSNDDDNIISLLFQKKRDNVSISYELHDFLLKRESKSPSSTLTIQLADLASQIAGNFYIKSGWLEALNVLTTFVHKKGKYQSESYVLANEAYFNLYNILKEAGIITSDARYPKGMHLHFCYKGVQLVYYAENDTVRVTCSEGHLGEDKPDDNYVVVTKSTTEDDLMLQLDRLYDFAMGYRFGLLSEFYKLLPALYGCHEDLDVPVGIDNGAIRKYQWVTAAKLCEGYSVAATISYDMTIETGLRRHPEQTHKEIYPEMPNNSVDYASDNEWWYYVKSYTVSHIEDAIQEIKLLLNQYSPSINVKMHKYL